MTSTAKWATAGRLMKNEGLGPWMSVTAIFPALGFVRGDVSPSVSAPDRLKR
jgi:hypothetical protein